MQSFLGFQGSWKPMTICCWWNWVHFCCTIFKLQFWHHQFFEGPTGTAEPHTSFTDIWMTRSKFIQIWITKIYGSFLINVSCSFKHTAIGECVFWVEILLGFLNGDWSMVVIETWRVGGLWNEHQMPSCKPWLDNAQKTYKWTVVNLMYDCHHHGNITQVQIAWNKWVLSS